jgi:hypothetical protein
LTGDTAEVAFAKEVYAACATVGFASPTVTRLKRLLDEGGDADEIVAVAQAAQRESIAWAGRPDGPAGR